MAITYVAAYAITQLIVFQFRASEPAVLLGLRQAQWTAIGMLAIAAPGLYILWRYSLSRTAGKGAAEADASSDTDASLEIPRPRTVT